MRRAATTALLALLTLLLGACGASEPIGRVDVASANRGGPITDGSVIDGRVTGEGSSFVEVTCAAVLDSTYELVAAINGFSDASRELDDAAERRQRYLGAFGAAAELAVELEQVLSAAPVASPAERAARADLVEDASQATATLRDGRRHAETQPLDDFTDRAVRSGTLFVDGEKARSKLFLGLRDAAAAHGIDELGSPCGRPPLPGGQAPAGS